MADERRRGDAAVSAGLSSAMVEGMLPVVRRILATLVLGSLVIAAVAVIGEAPRTSGVAAVNGLTTALLLVLLPRIGPSGAILGATLALLLSGLTTMAVGRGLHDTAIIVLPTSIFVGGLILSRVGYVAVTAAAVVGSIVIGVLQQRSVVGPRAEGRLDPLDLAAPPIILAVAAVLNAILVDAFRRSLSRAAMRERDYREVFDATHEAIFLLDPVGGRIVDANATAVTMFGLDREALLDSRVTRLSSGREGFEQAAADALLARTASEGPQVFEWLARRGDGHEFWVEVTLRRTVIGERERLLAVVRDIGERKRSEQALRQSEKLQAVGLLAGSVAHDFNNQLTGLVGYAELLRRKAGDPQAVLRYSEGILTAASRATSSTARLLTFARRSRQAASAVDVHALVREVAELLRRSVGPGVEVLTELDAREAMMLGDASQLQSALLNLGLNARDAMPQGGRIVFRTRYVVAEEKEEDVPTLELSVADTGHGMDAATRERIFDPFFTTRQTGTGLGLAAVSAAVRDHGGRITVESEPGRGSIFRLRLPSQPAPAGPTTRDVEQQQPAAALHGVRVLMAEDDTVAGRAIEEMLARLGCRVTWVPDGRAAVERFAVEADAFDAVLLDLLMPRLGGADASSEILRLRPDTAVVVMSGFDPQQDVAEILRRGVAFLPKPFHAGELAAVLGRALQGKPQAAATKT